LLYYQEQLSRNNELLVGQTNGCNEVDNNERSGQTWYYNFNLLLPGVNVKNLFHITHNEAKLTKAFVPGKPF
jgi:hypothetical protein